jgi:alpha-D-ribose 1-methylphosphonate 5-phosphate C-P lyase
MTTLHDLAAPEQPYSYAFLDVFARREVRRRILKAIAIPGYQVPYASRELPIARGWGTGGLQVTLSLIGPADVIKVIDQGADDSVNAANLRRFIARTAGVNTTTDAMRATLIQSRHRIPEERLREGQTLVLQVPDPEPLRPVEPSTARAHAMHADADYAQMWLRLYEQLVQHGTFTGGADYPAIVHRRYLMSPSPIPRWDLPKLHQAAHLTLLAAGREKRLYAVPPYTDVAPIEFDDVFFQVESQAGRVCRLTGATHKYMDELPQPDGTSCYQVSDSGYVEKLQRQVAGEAISMGALYYDSEGTFYHADYLHE